jgi:catechol 2,3-dioxygenase-like lactoylglutathione lyase family enzyme
MARSKTEVKPNSISGVSYYVEDLSKTSEFYEALGFRRGKEESDRVTFYVNWFFVTLIAQDQVDDPELQKEARSAAKGAGTFLHIKVDDIEAFHKGVVSNGMKPASEPEVQPSGNREFVLRDPDGYRLLFFQKK